MIIRLDKCHKFGIMKKNATSTQTKPKVYVNKEVIPLLKKDENYLQKYLNFLESATTNLNNIDKLPLHSNSKLNLYSKYLLSKL